VPGTSPGDPWRLALAIEGGGNGATAALGETLRQLNSAAGGAGGRLSVVLLPPLTEVRTIPLPPLREEERRRLLERHAARYFVSARVPQVVGTLTRDRVRGGEEQARGGEPVVAAAASHALVSAIHAAAADAGWTVDAVLPAEAAWSAAALAIWPETAHGTAHLLVSHEGRTDVLRLEDGRLAAVRRFPDAHDASALADALAENLAARASARVFALGATGARETIEGALRMQGVRVTAPPSDWAERAAEPDGLAARFAAFAIGPVLKSEEARAAERHAASRVALGLGAAAAALLVVAAGVHLWGVRREVSALRAERATLRPQIQASLVGRSSVETAWRQIAALARDSRTAPRWSALLAELAAHLPDDASLTTLRVRGDSVFLDGSATHAAPVFDDVARTPGLEGVRATAPVRREDAEGGDPLEHFSLGAKLARPGTAGSSPSTGTRGGPR
jgi:hypothetical protein